MFVTIINDCRDANAVTRQETRADALFNANVTFAGVNSDIEAAGNLIDTLDAAGDGEGVILVNVAPRHGAAKKWENGTPFAYFKVNNVLVVSTIDGFTLSLVKKYRLVESVKVMDITTVLEAVKEIDHIDEKLAAHIAETQFRSFEFLPRVAHWLSLGQDIPSETLLIDEIPDIGDVIWWIDNFGNAKTSLWKDEVSFGDSVEVDLQVGKFKTYLHLKDVPNESAALIEGSSGYGDRRFLEIVMQGRSAEESYGLKVGRKLLK